MRSIAIIGASTDRNKYGNKAVRAYKQSGWTVYPVNPNAESVEGLKCYPSISAVPVVPDLVSIYLPPKIGLRVIEEVAKKGVKKVIINPGAESDELIRKGKELGLQLLMICSIRSLGIDPDTL